MSPRNLAALYLLAAAMLTAAIISAVGCSSNAASVRKEHARALAASKPPVTIAAVARASEHFAKPAPRDANFAKYSEPDYGVSFRYPRNFALLDSAADDGDSDRVISWQQAKESGAGVRTAEELADDDPGATLIATVVVPDDAYPNTSFAGGSVQFAINRYQTARSCRANLVARSGDAGVVTGTVTAQGVAFAWIDINAGDGTTEFYERDYAGFSGDTCYEFFVRVGVGAVPAQTQQLASTATGNGIAPETGSSATNIESGGYRSPNERKIIAHLEKIVASLQLDAMPVSTLDQPKYKPVPTLGASN
jgi:hypothetical protein